MIKLYPVGGEPRLKLVSGEAKRARFVDHAYKCAPLTVANQYGVDLVATEDISVEWNGGPQKDDVVCHEGPGYAHFGQGTFTLTPGYIWRLPKGFDLLLIPVPNGDHADFSSMTALIEADWLSYPWFLSLNVTRPGRITIPAETPLARVMPMRRLADMEVKIETMPEDVSLTNKQWSKKRSAVGDHYLYRRNLQRGTKKCIIS